MRIALKLAQPPIIGFPAETPFRFIFNILGLTYSGYDGDLTGQNLAIYRYPRFVILSFGDYLDVYYQGKPRPIRFPRIKNPTIYCYKKHSLSMTK